MMEWLAKRLWLGQDGTDPVQQVRVWVAICLGYFFLLRISEVACVW